MLNKIRSKGFNYGYGLILLITSSISLVASFLLSVDHIRILEDPDYVPSCSINPLLSCVSVMASDKASIFGIPNPFFGLIAFTALITLAVIILTGALDFKKLPKWFFAALAAGATFGMGLVLFLIYDSLYQIGALCIYCMTVWSMVSIIWPTTLIWCKENSGVNLHGFADRAYKILRKDYPKLILLWYLLIILLIYFNFEDYFKSLI